MFPVQPTGVFGSGTDDSLPQTRARPGPGGRRKERSSERKPRKIGGVPAIGLPLKYRLLLKAYPWRRIEPVPAAVRRQPLSQSRVALVTSAGLVSRGSPPFDLARRGGDPSFRLIPADAPAGTLSVHHRSEAFDRAGLAEDLNVIFPREALARLALAGAIGGIAPRHLSFMGSITSPGRLIRDFAPEAASVLAGDAVDVALLVPV